MASHNIKVAGFDEVNWEVRVGVAAQRDTSPRKSIVVKSDGRVLETWLPQFEKQMSKPTNQNGVAG